MEEVKNRVAAESHKHTEAKEKRKVSKAWEAAQRLKGSVIINDPTLFML